jgi:hypothetical protein
MSNVESNAQLMISSQWSTIINKSKSFTKKRIWSQMTIDVDYEEQQRKRVREEQERVNNIYETLQKIIEIRRLLFSIGQYELEEGEII